MTYGGRELSNHLTPAEISTMLGVSDRDVIRLCNQESVPIYNGRIDKNLLIASLRESDYPLPETTEPVLRRLFA
mgnify:CR=1 FL=1